MTTMMMMRNKKISSAQSSGACFFCLCFCGQAARHDQHWQRARPKPQLIIGSPVHNSRTPLQPSTPRDDNREAISDGLCFIEPVRAPPARYPTPLNTKRPKNPLCPFFSRCFGPYGRAVGGSHNRSAASDKKMPSKDTKNASSITTLNAVVAFQSAHCTAALKRGQRGS
jgi:hypothetical protein